MQNVRRREWMLAVILAAVAGGLDAIGFLDLGGYFVSFMSGNTTRMSAEVVDVGWGVAWHAVGLVGLFFVGAVGGSILAHYRDGRVTVLAASTLLIALAAVLDLWSAVPFPPILIVAVAMGVMNATFLRDGEVAIGVTYMTGTLVKAAQRLGMALMGGPRWLWIRYLSLWAALAVGSLLGAWAYSAWGYGALWPVVAVMVGTTAVVWRHRRQRIHD
ncbi:YoaK family protein [Gordonia sp. (in: high G+C Gram-positive bacteria)]|uniref:YoaK family protein n=1 Tax=Gordonia sp. (in: high G+C Gram-positive bacteria) TaxID=84139 RepID=UPI003F9BBF65